MITIIDISNYPDIVFSADGLVGTTTLSLTGVYALPANPAKADVQAVLSAYVAAATAALAKPVAPLALAGLVNQPFAPVATPVKVGP